MSRQFIQTTVMDEYHRITQENGVRKYTHVTLDQYDGELNCFFILTHAVNYVYQPIDQPALSNTENEYLIRNGKEAVIRSVNLWNSVIMEKDYAPEASADAPADDDGDFPF